MCVTPVPNHVIRPAIAVMFANHPKSLFEPLLMPMYARRQKTEHSATDARGSPRRVVRANILGAFPEIASPYRAREDVYRSEDTADHAEVSSAALMTDGRPLMPPAVRMAMTNGEENMHAEVLVCVRDEDADDERAEDVEEQDADPKRWTGDKKIASTPF